MLIKQSPYVSLEQPWWNCQSKLASTGWVEKGDAVKQIVSLVCLLHQVTLAPVMDSLKVSYLHYMQA